MPAYEDKSKLTGEKLVKRAKDCFKQASEAEDRQRQREREDLEFQIPENQWDPEARKFRAGTTTTPARPMLSVSLLAQPMALIQNQAVNAKLGVEIHPVSESADPEIAEVKQGLYRRIERDSNAQLARLWALDRAKQCGRGWYRVNTQWDEDGDDEFDQEIVIERILNQENVYMDPTANKPDYSDARWALVVTYVPVDTFKEEWPDKEVPLNETDFKAWEGSDPEWVRWEGDTKAVLVAEYWWKEPVKKEIKRGSLSRQKEETKVRWALVTAREVLEERDWNGHYIPLIPVIGTELQPFDGQRIWEGMVRKARDAQKFFNVSISTLVERMALEPKAPFIGAEGQFEGHEQEWLLANVRNQPYLEYKPTTVDGTLAPPPQRSQIDSTGMSLALMALGQARELVQNSTAVYAPSLGEMPKDQNAQSGRAILALQQQSDAGTSHFLQNLANVSMQYEARVVLDLMPAIYDRPGRVVQILGDEDSSKAVMLGKPYVEHEGQPVPIPPGMPQPQNVKMIDLTQGKYSISVSIGKSFQTRLQEGATEIGAVLQAAPQLMPLIGPTYFRFRDFPGSKEIADLLKKVREKQFPGLEDDDEGGPSPEQLKGQIAQMGQQMQMMQGALQQAVQKIETEQAKQEASILKAQLDAQSTMQKAQLDADTKLRISAADNQTKLEIAQLSARIDEVLETLRLHAEAERMRESQAQEAVMGMAAQDHEAQMAGEARQHEMQMGARQQQHEAVMGELGREAPAEPEPVEMPEPEEK